MQLISLSHAGAEENFSVSVMCVCVCVMVVGGDQPNIAQN